MATGLDALDPDLASAARALVSVVSEAGGIFTITSTRRSHAEQTRLFRRSLQGLQSYPVAPPGTSAHEYGWAFDGITSPTAWSNDVGATWVSWGGAWGGRRDPVHFELPGASAAAKSAVQEPGSPAARAFASALDLAIGFLPGVGEAEIFATVLQFFPGWKESELVSFLSGPNSWMLKHPEVLFTVIRNLPGVPDF